MTKYSIGILLIAFFTGLVHLSGCRNSTNIKSAINDVVTDSVHGVSYMNPFNNDGEKHPLVIMLDSHTRGKHAVELASKAAAKFGFILVGSNQFYNQYPDPESLLAEIFDYANKNFNIDQKRIYLCAFSGAARTSAWLTAKYSGIKGCILCSASADQQLISHLKNKSIVLAGGTEDFNLLEMRQAYVAISSYGIQPLFLEFDGKHEWPHTENFNTILAWIALQETKENLREKNHSLEKLAQTTLAESGSVKTTAETRNSLNKSQLEMQFYSRLNDAYSSMNDRKVLEIIQEAKDNEGLISEPGAVERILSFSSMLSFLTVQKTINADDLNSAEAFIKIYEMVDPKNPDVWLLKANLCCQKNQSDSAKNFYNNALTMGLLVNNPQSETPPCISK